MTSSTLALLGVLLIGLKVFGQITWAWWLVLLPFWGGAVLSLLILFIGLLCACLDN